MERAIERMLAAAERLIAELDVPDNTDDEDSFDAEQTAIENAGKAFLSDHSPDDYEDSDPAGGDINDQGHDREPDDEPSLGWTFHASENGKKLETEGDSSGDLELDPSLDLPRSVYLCRSTGKRTRPPGARLKPSRCPPSASGAAG
jgi:hypothetical protein